MRRPITTTLIIILSTAGVYTINAQDTQQPEKPQTQAKTIVEFNKLRPDNKMPDAFYNSREFNAFYDANHHLSQADYQKAYHQFLHPSEKDPKPVFVNTGNPEKDRTSYRISKMEWLKKNSPFDYWKEQGNNSQEKRK